MHHKVFKYGNREYGLYGINEMLLCLFAGVTDRTWSGPAWSPALSLSSLLISIQSLMNEKPYHNEPGFEQVHAILHAVTLF